MSNDPHPFLVHFPIAWLPILALWAGVVAARASGRRASVAAGSKRSDGLGWLDLGVGLTLLVSLAAALTGESALARQALVGSAQALAGRHEAFAAWIPWLTGLALAGRCLLSLRRRRSGQDGQQAVDQGLRWGVALTLVAASGLAFAAGYTGGRLVHGECVLGGSAPTASPGQAPDEAPDRD